MTLQFHKNCQNIFQKKAVFHEIYIFGWFFFHVIKIFSSIEWSEKNIKIEKMAAVFLKILIVAYA